MLGLNIQQIGHKVAHSKNQNHRGAWIIQHKHSKIYISQVSFIYLLPLIDFLSYDFIQKSNREAMNRKSYTHINHHIYWLIPHGATSNNNLVHALSGRKRAGDEKNPIYLILSILIAPEKNSRFIDGNFPFQPFSLNWLFLRFESTSSNWILDKTKQELIRQRARKKKEYILHYKPLTLKFIHAKHESAFRFVNYFCYLLPSSLY